MGLLLQFFFNVILLAFKDESIMASSTWFSPVSQRIELNAINENVRYQFWIKINQRFQHCSNKDLVHSCYGQTMLGQCKVPNQRCISLWAVKLNSSFEILVCHWWNSQIKLIFCITLHWICFRLQSLHPYFFLCIPT